MDKDKPGQDGVDEARLRQLEEALAHLTRVSEDLSQVIARQDRDLVLLARRVDMLMRNAAEQQIEASGSIPLADQRPPHW